MLARVPRARPAAASTALTSATRGNELACAHQLRPQRCTPVERADMHREATQFAIEKEVAQGAGDGPKRKLAPGNLGFVEEAHVEAFRSRAEIEIDQPGAKHDIELVDMRQADHRVQRADVDV